MQLINIFKLDGSITLLSGLHIGSGDNEMHIGGTDNPIIKHPITKEPYIPGSSLKGKLRSLLEWRSGGVALNGGGVLGFKAIAQAPNSESKERIEQIIKLFGVSGSDNLNNEQALAIGPTRLSFWDCPLNSEWTNNVREQNLLLTEIKMENSINRISGTAENPRNTERVPSGAQFDFAVSLKQLDSDGDALLKTLLIGLKLLERDSLGGSGSRGYGKLSIHFNDANLQAQYDAITNPFDSF
jgi:CRISPR-associated protein Csm3